MKVSPGEMMSEGRCCDFGNFSRALLWGKRLSGANAAESNIWVSACVPAAGMETDCVLWIIKED